MDATGAWKGWSAVWPRVLVQAQASGLPVQASVTVSRLIRHDELPDTLRRLGFDSVSFSYPRREPLGSTSLVYGASDLVDLDREELRTAVDAIIRLKKQFPVLNPRVSLAMYVASDRRFPVPEGTNIFICTGTSTPGAARLGRAIGFGFRPLSACRPTLPLQCLHDGLLPQRQHADARRRRGHRCCAGAGSRSNRVCGGQRPSGAADAVALGTDRRDTENTPLGSPTEAKPTSYEHLHGGDRAEA